MGNTHLRILETKEWSMNIFHKPLGRKAGGLTLKQLSYRALIVASITMMSGCLTASNTCDEVLINQYKSTVHAVVPSTTPLTKSEEQSVVNIKCVSPSTSQSEIVIPPPSFGYSGTMVIRPLASTVLSFM